jgi:hypothetical protein
MEKFITILLKLSLILSFLLIASEPSCAQKKGSFDEQLDHNGGKRTVSFLVPTGYSATKKWPVVIAFHPAQTPQTAMRQMMTGAATQLNVILACPDDLPNYDGTVTLAVLDYLKKNYNIDESNIVLTGYSAGGGGTFGFGLPNYKLFKGLIGIATAPYYSASSVKAAINSLPIGFVCGTADQFYSAIVDFIAQAEPLGAKIKFIEKAGMGHTGEYFWGPEFTTDWVELYNYVQTTVFPPGEVSLKSPDDESEDMKAPVKFIWNKTARAKNYEFQIAEADDFAKITETKTITDSFYTVKTLKNNATYYWRVRAKNDGGNGSWSQTWSIKTLQTIPVDQPVLITPENDKTGVEVPVKFEWNIVDKATKYQIQVFEKNITLPVVDEKNVPAPQGDLAEYTATTLKKGKEFTWKVRGASADGDGPWSDINTFTTLADAPTDKPNLTYPPNNMEKAPAKITFEWAQVPGAEKYSLEIRNDGEDKPFLTFPEIPAAGSLMSMEVEGFSPSTKYWWRVMGRNSAGDGPWSDELSFTTDNFVSVDETGDIDNSITLSPNPAVDYININYNLKNASNVIIGIYNIAGESLTQTNQFRQAGANNFMLKTEGLQSGLYFVRIYLDNNYYYCRLTINR